MLIPPTPVGIETLAGINDGSHFDVEVFDKFVSVFVICSPPSSTCNVFSDY
jgi:hypothetical protein